MKINLFDAEKLFLGMVVFCLVYFSIANAAENYLFPLKEPVYVGNKILCTSWYSKWRTENGRSYQYKAGNFPCKYGSIVISPENGIVIHTQIDGNEGAIITIRFDDGVECTMAHLSKYLVLDGARVKRGQIIALSGKSGRTTGNHLRLRFDKNGERVFFNAKTWGKEYSDFHYSSTEFNVNKAVFYLSN